MKFPSLSSLWAFQVYLYKGSQISEKNYRPLVSGLQSRLSDLNVSVSVQDYSFFRRREFTEDTFIIGHSFGGYFALLDTLHDQRQQKHVRGVVLLHSHFNSQRQSWYPAIPQSRIPIPVLTISGGRDRRLPLSKVLPDLWEKQDRHLPNKFYKMYPFFSHFSGVNGSLTPETMLLVNDIETFIRGVHQHRVSEVMIPWCHASESMFSYQDPVQKIPFRINYKKSLNVLDALFSVILKPFFWEWIHHILFLLDRKSVKKNVVFTDYGDHILIKSYNMDLEQILKLCRESLPNTYKTRFHIVKLPTNLWGLYQWLLYPLALHTTRVEKDVYQWPVIVLPIRKHICYYKFLHPRQMILKQVTDNNRDHVD